MICIAFKFKLFTWESHWSFTGAKKFSELCPSLSIILSQFFPLYLKICYHRLHIPYVSVSALTDFCDWSVDRTDVQRCHDHSIVTASNPFYRQCPELCRYSICTLTETKLLKQASYQTKLDIFAAGFFAVKVVQYYQKCFLYPLHFCFPKFILPLQFYQHHWKCDQ